MHHERGETSWTQSELPRGEFQGLGAFLDRLFLCTPDGWLPLTASYYSSLTERFTDALVVSTIYELLSHYQHSQRPRLTLQPTTFTLRFVRIVRAEKFPVARPGGYCLPHIPTV